MGSGLVLVVGNWRSNIDGSQEGRAGGWEFRTSLRECDIVYCIVLIVGVDGGRREEEEERGKRAA